MTVRKLSAKDFVVLFAVILIGGGIVALNILSLGYSMA